MAYADYGFYTGVYFGDELPPEKALKWLTRASDWLDIVTRKRLKTAYPVEHDEAVKKAVCALAEALHGIEEQRKAGEAHRADDGTYRGAVSSITAGKQSISYAGSSAGGSTYAAAAASEAARSALLTDITCHYLADVPDANGTNLLYAGEERNACGNDYPV